MFQRPAGSNNYQVRNLADIAILRAKFMISPDIPDPSRWLEEYGDYLYRYALRRVRDEAVAEDLVQETLLAAWQSYSRFAGRGAVRTWLTGILKHKIIDYFRRASREMQIDPQAEEQLEHDELFRPSGEWAGHWQAQAGPSDRTANPASAVEQHELWQVLENCLGHLPQRIAAAFILREMEECDSAEICRALAVSPNNLWVMLHRARMQLRHCLETRWLRSC